MPRAAALVMSACLLVGCTSGKCVPPHPSPEPQWPIGLTVDEAALLSPEQCKAILVARAAVEAREGHQIHASYRSESVPDGWIVHVFFIPPVGHVAPTGYFCAVFLDPQFAV